MGGNVPLGYAANGRSLAIVKSEAATVRMIYDLYAERGTVTATTVAARKLDLRSKVRGGGRGGIPMGRGHIHAILKNPVYAGRIRHKKQVHPGQHDAIIEPDRWDAIQTRLMSEACRQRGKLGADQHADSSSSPNRSMLAGKLYDETGDRLTPSHANKKGRRYRYYVSSRLIAGGAREGFKAVDGWRLSAPMLEDQLAQAIRRHVQSNVLPACRCHATIAEAESLSRRFDDLCAGSTSNKIFLACIARAVITQGRITIMLDDAEVSRLLGVPEHTVDADLFRIEEPFTIRKRGVEAKLMIGSGTSVANSDPVLIDNLARAAICREGLRQGRSLSDLAAEQGLSNARIKQLLTMAFLAPGIVADIVQGVQPVALTSEWLQRNGLPDDWQDQQRIVGELK
ncbi:MAG: recombinase family protein [Pseudomonadota bacterium]